jgi:glycosyltransferase involved in cell wall biosynthesis
MDIMRRILVVTERFFPEEFIVNDLARQFREDGLQVTVLTQAPSYPFGRVFSGYRNDLFRKEQWENIRICRFFTVTGYRRSRLLKMINYFSFIVAGTIAALLIGKRYERVFIYQTGPLTMSVPGIIAGKRCHTKPTIWTQDVWPDSVYAYGFRKNPVLEMCLRLFVRWVYAKCGHIIVSCEGFREKLGPYCKAKTIDFVPNWPTMDFSGGTRSIPRSKGMIFTFAGNIGKVQNLRNVMLGYHEACEAKPGFGNLMIVGDGSALAELKRLSRDMESQGIEFLGRVPITRMPDILASSDVAIISLQDEPVFSLTVPSKFQAYLSAKKPILCAMKGEVARIVSEKGLGLVADPSDTHSIREAFLKFSELGTAGLSQFTVQMGNLLEKKYNRELAIRNIQETIFT